MFSWLDFYKNKLSTYKNFKVDPTKLLEKLKIKDKVLYDKVIDAGGLEILKEKFFHTIELSDGCFIPGTFDMKKHLVAMKFPTFDKQNVLDVGCADGAVTLEIAKTANHVTSMDAHSTPVKHVEFLSNIFDLNHKISAVECDFHAYKHEGKLFDVIVVMHVLCHHPKIGMLSFLDKADECINDNGILLVCDNTHDVKMSLYNRYNVKVIGESQLEGIKGPSILFECRKK